MKASSRRIAHAVRYAAEQQWPRCVTLRNRCLLTSYCLWRLFVEYGISSRLACGVYLKGREPRRHSWIETRSRIYDLTLTQFSRNSAKVSIFPLAHDNYVGLHYPAPELLEMDLRACDAYQEVAQILQRSKQHIRITK
jgi:Transglutaminase-like superfamily